MLGGCLALGFIHHRGDCKRTTECLTVICLFCHPIEDIELLGCHGLHNLTRLKR